MSKPNFYACLGLSRDASDAEVKKAYRRLALKYHPDRIENDEGTAIRFREIHLAYKVLSEPVSRKEYDRSLFGFVKSTKNITPTSEGNRNTSNNWKTFGAATFLFLSFISLVRCVSSPGKRESVGSVQTANYLNLANSYWISECRKFEPGIYQIEGQQFIGHGDSRSLRLTINTYHDESCKHPVKVTVGDWQIISMSPSAPGSRIVMTQNIRSATTELLTQAEVAAYNKEAHCDKSNWVIEQKISLLGTSCGKIQMLTSELWKLNPDRLAITTGAFTETLQQATQQDFDEKMTAGLIRIERD